MKIGRIIATLIGIICLFIALIYLVSPETIGGPSQTGEMIPQNMPGDTVTANFTTIPLPGMGSLVVPVFSAVIIFGVLGIALLIVGLAPSTKKQGVKQ